MCWQEVGSQQFCSFKYPDVVASADGQHSDRPRTDPASVMLGLRGTAAFFGRMKTGSLLAVMGWETVLTIPVP